MSEQGTIYHLGKAILTWLRANLSQLDIQTIVGSFVNEVEI